MSLLVTAHAYSLRENPSWLLSNSQESRFYNLLRELGGQAFVKSRGGLPIFGYRGFAVNQVPGFEPNFYVNRGIVDPGSHQASLLDRNRSLEAFLFETSGDVLDEGLREEVRDVLSLPADDLIESRFREMAVPSDSNCPNANAAADAPSYDPSRWNNLASIVQHNNCYNYVNDKINSQVMARAALPGKAHGINIVYSSCDGAGGSDVGPVAGAIADGLARAPGFPARLAAGGGWYVAALLSRKGDDCHWLRQDFAGCWSHKNGEDEVSNIDADGRLITDPRTANLGKYSIFCSFMVTSSRVGIR